MCFYESQWELLHEMGEVIDGWPALNCPLEFRVGFNQLYRLLLETSLRGRWLATSACWSLESQFLINAYLFFRHFNPVSQVRTNGQ